MKKALQLFLNSIVFTFKQALEPKTAIYLIPGAIFGLIFWEIYFILQQIENVVSFIESIPLIGTVLSWIIVKPIEIVQFLLIQTLTFIVLTLLSPINTFLSERIEFQLNGKQYPFSLSIVLRDLWRMIRVVTYLLFLEFFFLIIYWLIFGWYNPFEWLNDAALFTIGAFFYGISFFDYSFERHGLGLSRTIGYAKSNFWLIVLSGAFFLIIFSIPVVGIIIAPVLLTISTTYCFIYNSPKNFVSK